MRRFLTVLIMACTVGTTQGGCLEDGGFAYGRGDYATALRVLRPSAAQGMGGAQTNLGLMYANGHGVAQDDVRALMWFNLGVANISDSFRYLPETYREKVAARMTPAQIAQAQEMTSKCQASNYKQCGEIVTPAVAAALPNTSPQAPTPTAHPGPSVSVPMKQQGGTFVVPVRLNGALTLDFTVDSGASDVSIPADVVMTLVRTGTIREADFIGEQIYVLADGTRVKSKTFRIRSIQVGDKIIENVVGSIASVRGSLLLGQSFLGRFKSWSIDNAKHTLRLE